MKKTLLLSLALTLALSGCGLTGGNDKKAESNVLTPKEAKAKAVDFVNNNLLGGSGQKAEIKNVSEENQLYKFDVKVQNQTIKSYMTKDGEMFFPQGENMDNPKQNQTSTSSAQQKQNQQMSTEQRAQAVVSQTEMMLEQAGESVEKETKQKIEQKVKELKELNSSKDTKEDEVKNKIIEIQKLAQPIIQEMTADQGGNASGGVQVNPKK